jgi:hypothetical protein
VASFSARLAASTSKEAAMSENENAAATIEELIVVEPRLVAWFGDSGAEPDETTEDDPPEAA